MARGRLGIGLAAALAVLAAPAAGAGETPAPPPARVVSLNLCTDQLAMLLAAPGQLVAVSVLARDPRSSAMVEQARAWPAIRGQAEEVFLLRPDLVLAGSFTTPATLDLLRRLGIRVEVLPPPSSLSDVAGQARAVGRALGREAEAEALVARFEADLAALRSAAGMRPRAALYHANGYTGGERTLAGDILGAAGFANIAAEAGLPQGGFLPLEQLILSEPDAVIVGEPYPGASRAEEILSHPALRALPVVAGVSDADWVCATPHVLNAVARLRAAREALVGQ